jgi:hypothetical protein
MIKESVSSLGTGRGVLVDGNNRLIAGNKTVEAAVLSGIKKVIIVETTGEELVVHKRADLDLTKRNGKARKMAYADNRTSEVSYELDPLVLAADLDAGIDLSSFYFEHELVGILEEAGGELEGNDPYKEWAGMPEFEQETVEGAVKTLKVHFPTEEALQNFADLIGQNINMKTAYIWHPKKEKEDLKKYRVVNES